MPLWAESGNFTISIPGAIAEFERAIQLNPNDANAHPLAQQSPLRLLGPVRSNLPEMKRAQELDPLSLIINTNLGWAYIYAGRFDGGIAQMRKDIGDGWRILRCSL